LAAVLVEGGRASIGSTGSGSGGSQTSSPRSPKAAASATAPRKVAFIHQVSFGDSMQLGDLPSSGAVPATGMRRRHSFSCLKVDTAGMAEESGKLKRRVNFGAEVATPKEVFEAFTPYGKKYGAHPDDFFFDSEGHMVLTTSHTKNADVSNVKVKDMIECMEDEGVEYRTEPELAARFEKPCFVSLGDRVTVLEILDEWVRDSIGWLPLHKKDHPAFQVVVSKDKLRFVKARVPVMAMSPESPCNGVPITANAA